MEFIFYSLAANMTTFWQICKLAKNIKLVTCYMYKQYLLPFTSNNIIAAINNICRLFNTSEYFTLCGFCTYG